ncbi:LacI family DNA-binding transcriptional regulator [Microbacterium sp. CIAB417]|uniref:LacI family DNA-binding transcriptional regulator n=1 Tax=Microbacterium sp. CIAB417 TaxID=2860287 RepID=UPI001FAB492E|nr:LacI family DNA-binding transcriptional regulator [Microbacterium sp. CIAB417]
MPKSRRPTILDIAQRAGVSPTTVSHVLNNVASARVADATRERVEEAASEMGYRPNGLARALRTHRSNTLALISDEIATTPYAGELILGAQEAASRHGWLLMIMSTGGRKDVEEREIEAIWQHQVDGVLYAAAHHRTVDVPDSLRGKPFIVANGESSNSQDRSVFPDEFQGGYAATQELIFAGHTSIGFINTQTPIPARDGRLAGYRAALEDAGIRFRRALVAAGRLTFAPDGYEAAIRLLSEQRPTAVFCFNDRMAMGTYRAARELGLGIPDDLSIIGFDNQEIIAEALSPTLSSLALPYYQMGATAVDALVAELKGEPLVIPRQLALPSPVVRRQSVKRV